MAQHKARELRKALESPAVRSLRAEKRKQAAGDGDDELKQALKDSFPASDPVSVTSRVTAGDPTKGSKRKR